MKRIKYKYGAEVRESYVVKEWVYEGYELFTVTDNLEDAQLLRKYHNWSSIQFPGEPPVVYIVHKEHVLSEEEVNEEPDGRHDR